MVRTTHPGIGAVHVSAFVKQCLSHCRVVVVTSKMKGCPTLQNTENESNGIATMKQSGHVRRYQKSHQQHKD